MFRKIDGEYVLIDRREMLKVKVNSLAAEARIIRALEKKAKGVIQAELHSHRVHEVRREARHAHLAYGILKGRTIEQMEPTAKSKPDMEKVDRMLKKYGLVHR